MNLPADWLPWVLFFLGPVFSELMLILLVVVALVTVLITGIVKGDKDE